MRAPHAPLYDASFEHDACGVGFVADAGGRSRGRVLELALAGLASLRHRGAFAADGASSDGAGVALPLEPEVRARLGIGRDDAVVVAFLPPAPESAAVARAVAQECLAAEGLTLEGWRTVPVDQGALGSQALANAPLIEQGVVARPRGSATDAFERRLVLARRRIEAGARAAGLVDLSVPSASCRTVVYKGLVAGDRLAEFYLDLATAMPVSYAVFHQRYATNTHPRWALAQPFRYIAHNGEINTVRSNREQLRGRRAALGGRDGAALLDTGPLLSADASDSLSLDEALEVLMFSGRPLAEALLGAMPEALALRSSPHPEVAAFQAAGAGALAPWDGPAAIAFADGRHVGAVMDRNGLRPAAYSVTHDRLVALASEAGAIPIAAAETRERGRLGPGEMLLVDARGRSIRHDDEAKRFVLRRFTEGVASASSSAGESPTVPSPLRIAATSRRRIAFTDTGFSSASAATDNRRRWLAGLDAERLRVTVRAMALEGQEPLWSMGDDTPTPALSRLDRPVADHLRQSFAQVTNPAIDPERERIVMDLSVELGRRPSLLERHPGEPRSLHLAGPAVADVERLLRAFCNARGPSRLRRLDATWPVDAGARGLEDAIDRLAREALAAAQARVELLVLSDRAFDDGRLLPVPSALAAGAVHTAVTEAGLRGQCDVLVEAADILDVHAAAMALAAGATALHPWLALELAAEQAGTRGAEELTREAASANFVLGLEKGLRKVLARMGISCLASYVGGQFFEALEIHRSLAERCFPAAPLWPGTVDAATIAARQLRRLEQAGAIGEGDRLPDPGFVRYRAEGERHHFAPPIVKAIQSVAQARPDGAPEADQVAGPLAALRETLTRPAGTVRDQLAIVPAGDPLPLDDVEPSAAIAHRFVGAAMSLGALSPEAHQAITLGLRMIGAASNTGEGGEDPAWYADDRNGSRHDSAIKQVASARFGVTAQYLARAEQLEIKIAQGSKPGEGGQLPGRKATELIARLRRGQPGQSMISPPPHHDIYSIEDLAQLIADLRAINPGARIGVKLVASLGIGTIAAGVAKAGADYVQVSGHAGGTGASPLSSIKHAGVPWELGLAEVHQVLIRNALRDRVALRADGGLQSGRDVVIAALLGAEEYGFGTAALVAIGCDMARQCHLDTCPTGVATQREDLRAKFAGSPEHVARFLLAIADDAQRELADAGLRSIGDAIGRTELLRVCAETPSLDLDGLLAAPPWEASRERRASAASSRATVSREPASPVESRLASELIHLPTVTTEEGTHIDRPDSATPESPEHEPTADVTTADRSFGAHVSGLTERGVVRRPVRWFLRGSAGQSFGAFAGTSIHLVLEGQANDYVGKGLSGGRLILRPEPDLLADAARHAIAGNTCLYGATAGRVHVVGRAGMRFAVRNSGAEAVVEGLGPHGCEYMTGGTVVVLGPVGRNFGAGMTGGRAFIYDPAGTSVAAIDRSSVIAIRLREVVGTRDDGHALLHELRGLLRDHADAGSAVAAAILEAPQALADAIWLVEPLGSTVGTHLPTGLDRTGEPRR